MDEKVQRLEHVKVARLLKLAKKLNIGLEVGELMPEQAEPARAPAAVAVPVPRQPPGGSDTSSVAPLNDKLIEVKMRALVDGGAVWDDIRELAMIWLEIDSSPARGAMCFEICALTGKEADLAVWLQRWEESGAEGFWQAVKPDVRNSVILRLWKIPKGRESLIGMLVPLRGSEALTNIEVFAVFAAYMRGGARKDALLYFREHSDVILHVLALHAHHFGYTVPSLLLQLAMMAMNLGITELARRLLELISPDQAEYEDAADLLMKLKYKDGGRGNRFELHLAKLVNWEDKINYLRGLLERIERHDSEAMLYRPEINGLIRDLMDALPEDPGAISEYARLLRDFLHLHPYVPNIFAVVIDQSRKFTHQQVDEAFWQILAGTQGKKEEIALIASLAKVRVFLARGLEAETLFWEARPELLSLDMVRLPVRQSFSLGDWKSFVIAQMDQSGYLRPGTRNYVLALLRALTHDDRVAIGEIEDLLGLDAIKSATVLSQLGAIARAKRNYGFEYRLILRKATVSHLRNADLERLWTLSCELGIPDLSWRVATALQARHILRLEVTHARDACGIDRPPVARDTHPAPPGTRAGVKEQQDPGDLVSPAVSWFSAHEGALLRFFVNVGPHIPLLVKLLDPKAQLSPSPERNVASLKKRFSSMLPTAAYERVPVRSGLASPSELKVGWSDEAGASFNLIANSLGCTSVGFSLETFSGLIDDRFPLLSGKRYAKVRCPKTANWFKQLPQDAKNSFYALKGRLQEYPDSAVGTVLRQFSWILALFISGEHSACLDHAKRQRTQLDILWGLERFIVSPEYERIRQARGQYLNVPIPASIARLATIMIQKGSEG